MKKTSANKQENKIGFISLGCPKALVDSERIITRLRAEGYELVPQYEKANLVIVNTCGFIDSAVEESLDAIGEALEKNGKVIVTGCLGAKKDIIEQYYPDVLEITGPQAYESVMQAVHQHLPPKHDPFMDLIPPEGIRLTPRHYAYLKISEGCNHQCSFCIIPSMRGKLKSRAIHEVMYEAERLVKAGVKEILVISQDTSAYGVDLKYAKSEWKGRQIASQFKELVKELGELGVWIRLHYVYPYPHVEEIVPLMAEGKILPYLDIPFQHASPKILKSMKRPASSENNLERIKAYREICPNISIRSTFIVGFPGETEDDFQELLNFLDEARLDRVGCFEYSPVEGAAANSLKDPVPEEVKRDRYHRFMQKQAQISEEKQKAKIGSEMQVLIDHIAPEGIIARSYADAPEIDGVVHLPFSPHLQVGTFAKVKIVEADCYDIWGQIL